MNIVQSFLLGIVQGVTEFIPVSSSAHLVFLQHFFSLKEPPILFDCLLHFATLTATIIFFWSKIKKIIFLTNEGLQLLKLIVIASLPTGLIGYLFGNFFEKSFNSVSLVAFFLMLTGLFLWLAMKRYNSLKGGSNRQMKISDVLLIGTVQGLALLPGVSRSGSTISCAIILGWQPTVAAEFSFLLSIPAILGVTSLKLIQSGLSWLTKEGMIYFLGMVSAFILGLVSLKLLWHFLVKRRWYIFSYYCWGLGLGILVIRFLQFLR